MREMLTPGMYFEEAQASPAITSLRTDIAFFAGIAERGFLGSPVRIKGWEQFRVQYGEFVRTGYLAYAVKAFFESGGDVCWIARVAAPEQITQTVGAQSADRRSSNVAITTGLVPGAIATLVQTRNTLSAGPQPIDRLNSFVNNVGGFLPRSLVRIDQGPLRSFRHVKGRDLFSNRLDWDRALDPGLNLALPVVFSAVHQTRLRVLQSAGTMILWEGVIGPEYDLAAVIEIRTGAAKSSLDLLDESSHGALRVTAANEGAWGDRITVHIARSSRFATRTSPDTQPPGSRGLVVESVTGFRANQLIRIFQDGAGPAEFRVLDRVDVARRTIRWTGTPLPAGFVLTAAASGARPISIESLEFSLAVALDGVLNELFDDLTLLPADSQYFAPIVVARTSRLVSIEVLPTSTALQDRFPDPAAANLSGGTGRLAGGRDGTAALSPVEFLAALELAADVDEVAILAIPDLMIEPEALVATDPRLTPPPDPCLLGPARYPDAPPIELLVSEQAPSFTFDQIERVQQAMLTQCEVKMDRFAVLDPPPSERNSFSQVQSWRRRFDSKFGALYHPWILSPDPLRVENSPVRRVPPSGGVVGVYAANDLEIGVHHAPANRVVKFAQGAVEVLADAEQDILNPLGINCLRDFPGRGLRVWGARTLSSDSQWRFVNVRRLMSFIEEALQEGLAWAVFQPNNSALRILITGSVTTFLEQLWETGALVGSTADEAFYVRCDTENNPPDAAANGRLLIEIGVALVRPAEFVVIELGRLEDSFEIEEKRGGYGYR